MDGCAEDPTRVRSSAATSKDPRRHRHSFSYVLKSPESTNQKQKKKIKPKKLRVKNYTIYSRRNSLFLTYDTLNMYNHMQRTRLHERPEPVSFDMCKSQKCRKIPTECLSIQARMAKETEKKKKEKKAKKRKKERTHRTIHQQPRGVSP